MSADKCRNTTAISIVFGAILIPYCSFGFIRSIEISPAQPTSADTIVVIVQNSFPDLCWIPTGFEFDSATESTFEGVAHFFDNAQLGFICFQMIMDNEYQASFGPLAPGEYAVTIIENIDTERSTLPDTASINFVVDSSLGSWDEQQTAWPEKFKLIANYPNPFNATTKIEFELPTTTSISLQVFDVNGRLVQTLVDEATPAGRHSVTFDGTNLASGLYFARLAAGEFHTTQKMVLLK